VDVFIAVRKSLRNIIVPEDISICEDSGARKKSVKDHIQYVAGTQLRSLHTTHAPSEILTVLVHENRLATTDPCIGRQLSKYFGEFPSHSATPLLPLEASSWE
jgi:hypothetical protein